MADNFPLTPGSGRNAATHEVSHSGDTADVQLMALGVVTGAEGSKVVTDLPGDASNGLDVDVTRVQGTVTVAGDVAADAADSGNPLGVGGHARTTLPTAVANADRARVMTDKFGRLVTVDNVPRDLIVAAAMVTLTNTTETTLLAAGGAGVYHDLRYLVVTNTSTSPTRLDFADATGGTVVFSLYVPPSGGGASLTLPIPWPQATANNNWTVKAANSVTDVRVAGLFVKAA